MKHQHTVGSGNVFQDIGCEEPDEKLAKAELAFIINRIIMEKKLTQKEAAQILGVDQPKISALKHGKLSGFSMERLFLFLGALDHHIDIVISHKSDHLKEQLVSIAYT